MKNLLELTTPEGEPLRMDKGDLRVVEPRGAGSYVVTEAGARLAVSQSVEDVLKAFRVTHRRESR